VAYAVYTTEGFDEELEKLESKDQERARKIFLQLKDNPYVGDQIRYRFFREKRIGEKRIYYLVYDDLQAVLVVAVGGKKAQQETIDRIVSSFGAYRTYLEKKLKENSS